MRVMKIDDRASKIWATLEVDPVCEFPLQTLFGAEVLLKCGVYVSLIIDIIA
jgi:hypothetical protein